MQARVDPVEASMMALIDPNDPVGIVAAEHLATGGRRVRARLAMQVADVLGGPAEAAIAWAAACELLHNAALIHDDLQDQDPIRRGCPTLWASHGAARAIAVGDLLLMLPFRAIAQAPADAETRWRLADCLARHAEAAARAQYLELELPRLGRLDRGSWETVARGKTGAFFAMVATGAALLSGLDPGAAAAMGQAFAEAGTAYQACDDVNDLSEANGKAMPGSDLRAGRVNLVIVEHLALHPDDADWFRALLHSRPAEDGVASALDRLRQGGGTRAAGRVARELGVGSLASPGVQQPALRQLLEGLVQQTLARLPAEVQA